MSDPVLKPTDRPEFKQALKTGMIVLAVAIVVVVITIISASLRSARMLERMLVRQEANLLNQMSGVLFYMRRQKFRARFIVVS